MFFSYFRRSFLLASLVHSYRVIIHLHNGLPTHPFPMTSIPPSTDSRTSHLYGANRPFGKQPALAHLHNGQTERNTHQSRHRRITYPQSVLLLVFSCLTFACSFSDLCCRKARSRLPSSYAIYFLFGGRAQDIEGSGTRRSIASSDKRPIQRRPARMRCFPVGVLETCFGGCRPGESPVPRVTGHLRIMASSISL